MADTTGGTVPPPLPTTRLEKETAKAYAAFRAYCELGPERSIAKLVKEHGKSSPLYLDWSSKWKWQDRSATYDREQNVIQAQATAQAALEGARERQKRRDQIEGQMWDLSQTLVGKVKEMLAFPVAEKTVKQGPNNNTTIIVKPGKWTFTDVVRAAHALKELGCYAVGLPTQRTAAVDSDGDDLVAPPPVTADGQPLVLQAVVRVVHETKDGKPVKPPQPTGAPAQVTPKQPAHGSTGVHSFSRS